MTALEAHRQPAAPAGPSPSPDPEARQPGRVDVDRLERRRRVPGPLVLAVLAAGLAVAAVAAAGTGAYPVPASEVLASVLDRLGLRVGTPPDAMAQAVLWEIRFPRIALAAVVGGSLATAGATMQGTFGNPLAEPGIVGVSSGAVLGAVLQIVVGLGGTGPWSVSVAAFAGGLVTITVVYLAARSAGRTEVVTLILTGIAVNAFTGAVIGLMTYLSDDAELRSITFWTLGSVAQATWSKVGVAALVGVVAVAGAVALARPLDLLALGDAPARHLGVDVESLRRRSLAVVALLTAAAVAVSGVVLFVGLVIPHLVRMVAGPAHRLLIPASALAGALVLVVADLLARTLVAPAELPLGVLTALVGSPFFFWQLRRTRARQGGWA